MEQNSLNTIAKNIKKYRLLNNMTQEELAQKLYLDTQYYAQLERGKRNFTIEKIMLACSTFHIGIEDIIEIESPSDADAIKTTINNITSQLEGLSYSQLQLIQKFISDIIPYCK